MRKILVGEFLSLDGVMEDPGEAGNFKYRNWTAPYYSEEVGQSVYNDMSRCDTLLMGRKTYETFAAAFAHQTGGMADTMNSRRKYVVSTTLKKADWQNSTLISSNVAAEVARIKEQPGMDIAISGSGALVRSLLQAGLINELSLLVYPLVLGSGLRLFQDTDKVNLKLVEAKAFGNGVVHFLYQPG